MSGNLIQGNAMQTSKLISVLIAGLFLGGCAELKEFIGAPGAPIEDRNAVATTGEGASISEVLVSSGTGQAAVVTESAGSQVVETMALPSAGGAESQAMSNIGATSLAGASGVVGLTPAQAAMLRDPASPLSKRVIYFDLDSDAVRAEYRDLVEAHAGFLKDNGAARIILQGHTDERGSRDYNLALGQRRAEAVKQAMSLLGLREEQAETVSLGEEKPVQEGNDESAWQLNRRAEIHYLGE
jgi:peptidoglycan-associated lipoprotein